MDIAAERRTPRRAVELIGMVPDHRGVEGLAIAVVVKIRGQSGNRGQIFPHDETPEGLAGALYAASEWVRAGAP
jgi:hypothetical protein